MFLIAPDLNRSVAFIRVREPFAAWVREDPAFGHITAQSINEEGTAYLLPDIVMRADAEAMILKYWRDIFEHELFSWSEDEKSWPQKRTYTMFREWFEVHFSSLCRDLVDAPIDESGG